MNKKPFITLGLFIAVVMLGGASCISTNGSATGPMGVYRSEDKGENWKKVTAYPTPKGVQNIDNVKVYRIFTDPSDHNAMYLGTRGQGLYFTYNNGDSWQFAEPLAGKFIYSVVVDYKDKCNVYVTDGTSIFKTTDCSRTWKTVYSVPLSSQRISALGIDYANAQTIYASLVGKEILVSNDGGGSWSALKRFENIEIQHLATDPLTPRRIYVASYDQGLARSDDGGLTWKDLRAPFEKFANSRKFHRLLLHPKKKDTIFWVSEYGILRSDDAGVSWKEIPLVTSPGSVNIYTFEVNPNNDQEMYYTGTVLGDEQNTPRSIFYTSVDGGATWSTKKLPTNTIPVASYSNPTNNMLFLGFTTEK